MILPDITCYRHPESRYAPGNVCHVNLGRRVVHHSPDGFEWGYAGSGPADLALSILDLYVPPGWDNLEPVPLYRGKCSAFAFVHHQHFKRHFIGPMPDAGGVIPRAEIIAWIKDRWAEYQPPDGGE